jgi:hypothetical protein
MWPKSSMPHWRIFLKKSNIIGGSGRLQVASHVCLKGPGVRVSSSLGFLGLAVFVFFLGVLREHSGLWWHRLDEANMTPVKGSGPE